jgi:hypothetical protein
VIGVINDLARVVGMLVLGGAAILLVFSIVFKLFWRYRVSEEARQMAKEVDPNNSAYGKAAGLVAQGILESVRELEPDETIRSRPQPIVKFDWSMNAGTESEVRQIMRTLEAAGYYTHPFPKISDYKQEGEWSSNIAGVWHEEPEWHIAEFNDDDHSWNAKESVELPEAEEWDLTPVDYSGCTQIQEGEQPT